MMDLGTEAWGEPRGTSWTSSGDVWKALEFYGRLEADHANVRSRMDDRIEEWATENQRLLSHVFRVPSPPPWDGRTFPSADTPTNGGSANE